MVIASRRRIGQPVLDKSKKEIILQLARQGVQPAECRPGGRLCAEHECTKTALAGVKLAKGGSPCAGGSHPCSRSGAAL